MTARVTAAAPRFGVRYFGVLGCAVICYAALGAVLRDMPHYVQHQLHGSAVEVGLAVGAPSLTGAVLRPIGGRFADRSGPAAVLMIGAGVMAAGVIPAAVQDIPALILSRLLVGAGEAVMMSAAVLWLLNLAGPERRGVALGHIGLANYAGLTVGPLLADALQVEHAPDRLWVTAAILPLVALAATATLPHPPPHPPEDREATHRPPIARLTLRPGIGLLLVNVGYVAVLSFGAAATDAHHLQMGGLIVPLFGLGVIISRTALAPLPQRLGGRTTLTMAALVEAAGLATVGLAGSAVLGVVGLVMLSVGQGLAVPALGLLALADVPPAYQGAAAGTFFAYFDAGVGLGGPAVGAAAGAFDAPVALAVAGGAVALSVPTATWTRRRRRRSAAA